MQTYNTSDVDLVMEWANKYVEICTLLKKVFAGENSVGYPPPLPSIEDEIEFQRINQLLKIAINLCEVCR